MREKSNSFEIQRIGRSTSFKVLRSSRNSTQLPTKPPLQIFQAGCMQRRTEPPLQIFQAACAATLTAGFTTKCKVALFGQLRAPRAGT